jgi:RNA polymerase sigma-70 factor (ECF subfamily)
LRDEERIQAWVYQVARNAIADHFRRSRPTVVLTDVPFQIDDAEDGQAAQALACSVRQFVDALSPNYRDALVLTAYEGLTQVQLADKLGISVSGAKSRVQRARNQLKAALLACCHVQRDRRGGVNSYSPRGACCVDCDR